MYLKLWEILCVRQGSQRLVAKVWFQGSAAWQNSLDWLLWADVLACWRHHDAMITSLVLAQWFISCSRHLQPFNSSKVHPMCFPFHTLMWLNFKITCSCGVVMSSASLSSSHVTFGLCLPCQFCQSSYPLKSWLYNSMTNSLRKQSRIIASEFCSS